MSLLSDAREILNYGPGGHASLSDSPCVYCCFIPHQEECIWLSMAKIVAALEAAEMVVQANHEDEKSYSPRYLVHGAADVLEAAMRSEPE